MKEKPRYVEEEKKIIGMISLWKISSYGININKRKKLRFVVIMFIYQFLQIDLYSLYDADKNFITD
jgi:hypothetical protein